MNHKDIFERAKALETDRAKGYELVDARINKEQESLQELCASMGHLPTEAGIGPFRCGSECVVCGADVHEPKQVETKVITPFGKRTFADWYGL